MNRSARKCHALACLVAILLGAGCEEEGANESPVGPDISGDWSGQYISGTGEVTPIKASIAQSGSAIFIETSMPTEGHLLVGTLSRSGSLFMTDSYSAETWTAGEPVTSSHVQLIDYAFGPGSSLRYIDLTR